jgi:hypothetical protein
MAFAIRSQVAILPALQLRHGIALASGSFDWGNPAGHNLVIGYALPCLVESEELHARPETRLAK